MKVLDVEGDAARAFDILQSGGIALLPMDVGYSLIGGSTAALKTIFDTKQRAPTKLNAMLGDDALAHEIYDLSERGWAIVDTITRDYDLPLGIIGPCHMDHRLLQTMAPDALAMSTRDATLCMLTNAGPFHAAICRLSREQGHPLFGSSANRSLQGTKFRVGDIEPDVRAIADIVIDYGLLKYHLYKASSTLLDVETLTVVRYGACFELIADIVKRHFGVTLPSKPDAS